MIEIPIPNRAKLRPETKMKTARKYTFEFLLVVTVMVLTITGFWKIYFGVDANPTPYQNLHVITHVIWLVLLLYQLSHIEKKQYSVHRRICGKFFRSLSVVDFHGNHQLIAPRTR